MANVRREDIFYLISVCTVTVRELEGQKGLYRQFQKKSTNKSMFVHKVALERVARASEKGPKAVAYVMGGGAAKKAR